MEGILRVGNENSILHCKVGIKVCQITNFFNMAIQLKVPSIACSGCADTITKAIKNHESTANVQIDVEQKIVTVETKASEDSIKQAIASAGHTVE